MLTVYIFAFKAEYQPCVGVFRAIRFVYSGDQFFFKGAGAGTGNQFQDHSFLFAVFSDNTNTVALLKRAAFAKAERSEVVGIPSRLRTVRDCRVGASAPSQ